MSIFTKLVQTLHRESGMWKDCCHPLVGIANSEGAFRLLTSWFFKECFRET